jgi:hypothetical protein
MSGGGGHGDGGYRLPLVVLTCTNPMVGIHKKSLRNMFVSCKNILFWSKFYSGCPDTPNRIYSILYLDQV